MYCTSGAAREMNIIGYRANRYRMVPSLNFLHHTYSTSSGSVRRVSYVRSAFARGSNLLARECMAQGMDIPRAPIKT